MVIFFIQEVVYGLYQKIIQYKQQEAYTRCESENALKRW